MAYQFLFIDYESFSLADLEEVGLDNYVKHPSTEISMLNWALDQKDVETWLPHKGPPSKKLLDAFHNPSITKIAWNVGFDYNITEHVLPRYIPEWKPVPLHEYRDPIVLAHNISLPGRLKDVARILKMANLKDERGEKLVQMFCLPVSKGGEETLFGISPPLFRTQESHPREFAEYIQYGSQDVRAMRDLWYRLLKIPFPDRDWMGWLLDQKVNHFGMPGRRDLAEKGLRLAQRYIDERRAEISKITGLSVKGVNSPKQMMGWAIERGYPWQSLRANFVKMELDNPNSPITPECRVALAIRQKTSHSSYKKLERFLHVLSSDDRLRHQFRYMAAPRTGRWAGGDVQVQNMFRGSKEVKKKLLRALELLNTEDYDAITLEFPKTSVVEFVITLLRSMFQAKEGKKIVVADLNAIENRVLGWVAGCWSILEVFTHSKEEGGDPYLSFGTRLYKKSYAEMYAAYAAGTEDERQNSKPAVLGAGYGLGGGEMYTNEFGDEVRGGLWGYALNVCGVDMPKELAHEAVRIFREVYPEVVQLWMDLEEAFRQVLKYGGIVKVGEVTWDRELREWVKHPTCLGCVISFTRITMADGGYMIRMELPSGRALHYLNATIEDEQRFSKKLDPETGKPYQYTAHTIYYDGIEHSATQDATGQKMRQQHKWGRVKTYGGKLCENAVQAISRDLLLHGATLADDMGFHIFGWFHDELACEEDAEGLDQPRVEDLCWCMSDVPDWALGYFWELKDTRERSIKKDKVLDKRKGFWYTIWN